jgi:KUP system potassium uptake protein
VRQNRSLRETVVILRVEIAQVPWIDDDKRVTIAPLAPHLWRANACYGFMERPDIPAALARCAAQAEPVDLEDVTYYLEHGRPVASEEGQALPAWRRHAFAFMARNSDRMSRHVRLPPDQTVEIERIVAI